MFTTNRLAMIFGAMLLATTGCGPDRDDGRIKTNPNDPALGPPDMTTFEWDGGFSDKCGVQDFQLAPGLPPEVMIVLDRSGSMTLAFDGGTRWSKVAAAVKSVVSSLQGQIGWGLTVYPSDNDCGTSSSVDVLVAAMNGPAVSAKIDSYTADGNTPTAKAVQNATTYMAGRTTQNPKYLLLTSDGEPNCGGVTNQCVCLFGGNPNAQGQCCAGPICYGPCSNVPTDDGKAAAVQAVTDAANQGINTFVIGVAASGAAASALDELAVAGKEPATGSTKYYSVGSQADLVAAVNTIAGQIISCSFSLASPPPADLDLVEVNLNGQPLARDTTHAGGWDFGTGNASIVFYGAACQGLQSASSSTVQAIYKCPPTL